MLESVHTPIGLPIGGETPEEIGVSIIAEVIQEKNRCRKRGGFTKEILKAILDEKDKDIKKVLATIVTKKAPRPEQPGQKCWFTRMEELWEPSAEAVWKQISFRDPSVLCPGKASHWYSITLI